MCSLWVVVSVVTMLLLLLARQDSSTSHAEYMGYRLGCSWRVVSVHHACKGALGGEKVESSEGKLCPTGRSRDSACDVGGKQPVSGGLVGRMLMSWPRRGQGSESALEGCLGLAVPCSECDCGRKHGSEVQMLRNNLRVPGCLGWLHLLIPLPSGPGRGEGATAAAGLLLPWCVVLH